jgi:predicted RND superfamily exporter protein
MNSSAQTVVSGVTVFEPIILNEPESSLLVVGGFVVIAVVVGLVVVVDSLQLLTNTVAANITSTGIMNHFLAKFLSNFSS